MASIVLYLCAKYEFQIKKPDTLSVKPLTAVYSFYGLKSLDIQNKRRGQSCELRFHIFGTES